MNSNELPGTVPRSSTPHPRRPPAHKSVSLRHSPPIDRLSKTKLDPQPTSVSSPTVPASDRANPPSSVSPNLATTKNSSGESSDAGKWFERTNNKAQQGASFAVDNEPPFFLNNSSSSDTPPEGYDSRSSIPIGRSTSIPYRPGMMRMETDGSSTEDFRSVIDDLTIANKKLKKKLRKYEKLYDAHLQDEKLFEVRFHGLPDHKKRELEQTLRKFAAEIDGTPSSEYPNMKPGMPLDTQPTASSTSRFAESGYASMSGQQSSARSGQNSSTFSGPDSDRQKVSKSQYKSQQQSIQSYLHDIPAGLLPKQNAAMSEGARKRLVVRRLEEIFAGKPSVPGNHPQPMQQEEVAQSAAMADRREREATGKSSRKEGLREARIMPVRTEDEDITTAPMPETLQRLRPNLAVNELDFAGNESPNQRPTRPLDLDLYRAQVPAENMDYIRHLGFTPPNMQSEESLEDGHGWIYLNLLINMAQLHTINVTPDFIKDALNEYSSTFELSHDGRKIRWKGGNNILTTSDTSPERLDGLSPNDPVRLRSVNSGDSNELHVDAEKQARQAARFAKEKMRNKFAYTPIFLHKQESEEDDESYNYDLVSSSNSPYLAQQRGDSSGFGSSAMRSSPSRKRREDGPMIFYSRAKFCTDLSGDRRLSSIANPASTYKSFSSQPLGVSAKAASSDVFTGIGESKSNFTSLPMELDKPGSECTATSSGDELGFSPPDLCVDSTEGSQSAMDFEASGLGGVRPDDNFAIRVRRSHVRVDPSSVVGDYAPKQQHYPRRILDALDEQNSSEGKLESKAQPTFKSDIASMSRRDLPSSSLPPASFLPFYSTSSGDIDSDLQSDVSSDASPAESVSDEQPEGALLNVSPQHQSTWQSARDEDGNESDESGAESDDTDASVDLLATARMLDPSKVRESEREYDAELAERLAEEIPAGSSAATAGGGSGFNSPMSVVVERESDAPNPPSGSGSSSQRAQLKRARASDNSIAKALQPSEKSQKLGVSHRSPRQGKERQE